MKKAITITNLEDYQHYNKNDDDRKGMPWIKWNRRCLTDYKFCQLNDNERWIFIGLILLATENNNKIPADFHFISKKISNSKKNISEIILKLVDLKLVAIVSLAKRKRNFSEAIALVEKSREDKKREEKNPLNNLKNANELLKEHLPKK